MLRFLRVRRQQGTRVSPFPQGGAEFPERFRGRPVLYRSRCEDGCRECQARMPSGLLDRTVEGQAWLDVGACLFAPEEAAACPNEALGFTTEHRMAARTRGGLWCAVG